MEVNDFNVDNVCFAIHCEDLIYYKEESVVEIYFKCNFTMNFQKKINFRTFTTVIVSIFKSLILSIHLSIGYKSGFDRTKSQGHISSKVF